MHACTACTACSEQHACMHKTSSLARSLARSLVLYSTPFLLLQALIHNHKLHARPICDSPLHFQPFTCNFIRVLLHGRPNFSVQYITEFSIGMQCTLAYIYTFVMHACMQQLKFCSCDDLKCLPTNLHAVHECMHACMCAHFVLLQSSLGASQPASQPASHALSQPRDQIANDSSLYV
jgi:hypothetical protein